MSFISAAQLRAEHAKAVRVEPKPTPVRPEPVAQSAVFDSEEPHFTSSDGGEERAMVGTSSPLRVRQAQGERDGEDGANLPGTPELPETPAFSGDRVAHFTDTTATSSLGHHTVFTPQAQGAFLESLAHRGNVRLACRAASVSAQTVYRARRRSVGFARAWDTALVSARVVAEDALADRALNGWEEPVFYHGEEIARRRRFSDRLLLAHLARLDKLAETMGECKDMRSDSGAGLAVLDDHIEALQRGEELPELAETGSAQEGADNFNQDPVPPVPSCRDLCSDCGGNCDDPDADLGPEDCQWLGNRIERMSAARPKDAPETHQQADGFDETEAVEALQLEAFEADGHEWWLVTTHEELIASCTFSV